MVDSDTLNEVIAFTHVYRMENGQWPTAMNYYRDGPLDAEQAKTILQELVDQGLLETKQRAGQQVEIYKFNGT